MAENSYGGILGALLNTQAPATLFSIGGTREPQRATTGTINDLYKLFGALNGGAPVTTSDLIRPATMDAGFPAQSLRDLMNLLIGRPQQVPGNLIEYDPYNPFHGGT